MTDERIAELTQELADVVKQVERLLGRVMEISDRLEGE